MPFGLPIRPQRLTLDSLITYTSGLAAHQDNAATYYEAFANYKTVTHGYNSGDITRMLEDNASVLRQILASLPPTHAQNIQHYATCLKLIRSLYASNIRNPFNYLYISGIFITSQLLYLERSILNLSTKTKLFRTVDTGEADALDKGAQLKTLITQAGETLELFVIPTTDFPSPLIDNAISVLSNPLRTTSSGETFTLKLFFMDGRTAGTCLPIDTRLSVGDIISVLEDPGYDPYAIEKKDLRMELQWYIYTKRECWMWGKNKLKGMAATRLFDGLTNSCDNGDNGDNGDKN